MTFLASGLETPDGDERNPVSNDNNLEDTMHTDLYSNGDAFTLGLNEEAAKCSAYSNLGSGTTCFSSKYEQSNAADDDWAFLQFAISSFPHNDLGKDFRFNLRMLHHLGEGDSYEFYDSYYFYRVNEITITFPTTVGCPFEQKWDGSNGVATIHKCMDSAAYNGHQMWHMQTGVSNPTWQTNAGNGPETNVDTVSPKFVETLKDTLSNTAKFTYICKFLDPETKDSNGAVHAATLNYHWCGDVYKVTG